MACYRPLKAWRSRSINPSGKRPLVFDRNQGFSDLPVEIPCGQCIGCKLERSRQWAIRCHHEASLHQDNCFLTLTYNDENLPPDGSLDVSTFQRFMKRLRKHYGTKIRYFHCGEYGDDERRPHYHAIIFNHDFSDKLYKQQSNTGHRLYTSDTLNMIWGLGFCLIGDVTFDSAAYVARYITKKVTGDDSNDHYLAYHHSTGDALQLSPEYTTMSRRPGIGKNWLDKYTSDIYNADFVVINGRKMRAPKFYDTQFELSNPAEMLKLKGKRKKTGLKHADNNTLRRLQTRERVKKSQIEFLERSLDRET